MKNILKFDDLLLICKFRKSHRYYYEVEKFKDCFTGDIHGDIPSANQKVSETVNNNTAHGYVTTFRWAYQLFYGKHFNPKWILSRAKEISKFTTRLDHDQIRLIRTKFGEWINFHQDGLLPNKIQNLKESRLRIYHCFESLLNSGMRVGELAAINFKEKPINRIIYSKLNHQKFVEIIINTEKTCKKREIYIPYDSYLFFFNNNRKYKFTRPTINTNMIICGFSCFAKWANLPFRFTAHVLRRTKATLMHEGNVDIHSIAMVLGNTPKVVMEHYILSSTTNFDATEIGSALGNGTVEKIRNVFLTKNYNFLPPK